MNPRFRYRLLVLCFIAMFSQAPSVTAMTLLEAVQSRLNQAPQIEGQHRLYDLSEQEKIRRFIPNEPQFQYTNTDSNTEQSFGFNESIGFPGKALALSRIDKAQAEKQKGEWQASRYDIAKDTVQSYLDCAAASSTSEIQKNNLNDVETLVDYIRSRYEAGVATLAELIGAKLQARQQHYELAGSQDKAKVSCDKLIKLLDVPNEEKNVYELPDDLDPAILEAIGEQTADEDRAQGAIELAKASGRTAWASQMPDLNFNYLHNRYVFLPGSPNGHENTTTYGVAMNIPIFFGIQERIDAQKAKSQALIDRSNSELALLNARSDRAEAAREYQRSSQRLRELREKDVPLAEAAMESTYSSYRAGKLGFAELLLARKNLADLRVEDIELRTAIINSHLRCLKECGSNNLIQQTLISYDLPKKN